MMCLGLAKTVLLFLSQDFKNCLIYGKKMDFCHVFNLKYQFFAFNWIHYQKICTILGFLNSEFKDESFGTHMDAFFFTCISEKFNLIFHKNWFLVVNFNFSKFCLLSKTNPIHIEGSAMPKSVTLSGH